MTADNLEMSSNETNIEGNGTEGSTPDSVSQDVQESAQTTTDKVDESTEAKEVQINYGEEFPRLQKSYKDLQRKFTEVTQDRSSMKDEFQVLQDAMTKLQSSVSEVTKKPPPSPEQFIQDLQANGIGAIQPLFDERINSMKDTYQKDLSTKDGRILALEAKTERLARKYDPENYPDFAKLEPEIAALAESPNCPVDFSKPIGEVMDALYNLVRSKHSSDALLAAEDIGKKKAEENLVRESKTTVTGGGKGSVSSPDLSKISDIKKLREIVANMHGVAERD